MRTDIGLNWCPCLTFESLLRATLRTFSKSFLNAMHNFYPSIRFSLLAATFDRIISEKAHRRFPHEKKNPFCVVLLFLRKSSITSSVLMRNWFDECQATEASMRWKMSRKLWIATAIESCEWLMTGSLARSMRAAEFGIVAALCSEHANIVQACPARW